MIPPLWTHYTIWILKECLKKISTQLLLFVDIEKLLEFEAIAWYTGCVDNTWRRNMTWRFLMVKGIIHQQENMLQRSKTIRRWMHLFLKIIWSKSGNTSANMNVIGCELQRSGINSTMIVKLLLQKPLLVIIIKPYLKKIAWYWRLVCGRCKHF